MSRRTTIIIALLAAAVFAVVYFWPEDTYAGGVGARLHLGDRGVNLGAAVGGVRFSDGRERHRRDRDRWRRHHRDHWHRDRWDNPATIVVVPPAPRERVTVREVPVPAAPVADLPVTPLDPGIPLNPGGQARTVPVRGVAEPREWLLGATLPPDLPHVALDPVAYGLPLPPEGQLYARVDGDVLRIEAGSRRILGVLAR